MQVSVENYAELRAAIEELSAHFSAQKIPEEKGFDGKLVAYELLGNVLQHSGGRATLTVEIGEGCLRMRLRAENPFHPPQIAPCPDAYAERGRGLFLVDSVCVERRLTPEGDILVVIKL